MSIGIAELHIVEVRAIVEIIRHVAEDAEDGARERLRPAAVSLLYIANDKLGLAEKALAKVAR